MIETEYNEPLTAGLCHNQSSSQTFEWTGTDSLDFDITYALVNSLDVDYEDFVLQEAIDTDALAKLIGDEPGSPAPTDTFVSFRLERCDCTVVVHSDGRIEVWTP